MADDARLERIESKLDTLSDAVVSLARMEERMITLFKRMDKYDDGQTKLTDRVSAVEKVTIQRGVVYQMLDKGFWLVVGAGLAWITRNGV